VYIHKNFVVNSKNQNSYFGLIVKASRNGAVDFTLRNTKPFTNFAKRKQKQREYKITRRKKRIFRSALIIKIMPSGY